MKKVDNSIILAAGEGSRMQELTRELGIPKHLLSIGETNVTQRLIDQMKSFSGRVIVVTTGGKKELFHDNTEGAEIFESGGTEFFEHFQTLQRKGVVGDMLVTTGDLVFPDGSIESTVSKMKASALNLVTDVSWGIKKGLPIRLAYIKDNTRDALASSSFSPESIVGVFGLILQELSRNGVPHFLGIETLANLNTPQDYSELMKSGKIR